MALMDDLKCTVDIKFNVSLWDAIKIRIAGMKNIEKDIKTNIIKAKK